MNIYSNNSNTLPHLDGAQTVFFLQELTQMKNKVYQRPTPILKATELIPVDTTTNPGAQAVNYRTFDNTVNGRVIANYADDLPFVDVMGQLFVNPIISYGNAYEISIQDIKAAMFAGVGLESRKANACIESHMIWMNNMAFYGDPITNVTGWLNNPILLAAAVPVAGDSDLHKTWAYKATVDPALIVADLNEIATAVMNANNGLYQSNRIVLPLAQYNLIQSLRMGAGTDTTVLEFFSNNNRGISLHWANEMQGAFNGKDGMIAYRFDSDDFWQEIPQAAEFVAPQWNNLAYKVPCHSRHGGTIVVRPQSQALRTGI